MMERGLAAVTVSYGAMTDVSRVFLDKSRSLIASDYLPKVERCLDRLTITDIWWRPNEASNSVGNLILHLCGNMTMWILGGVGRLPFARQRQQEFDERRNLPSAELRHRLRTVVREADHVMSAVSSDELLSRRHIQDYDVTVLEAIYHVVEHFGMHTGQIIVLSKMRLGTDLSLWEPPVP
jgi:uncharacterized damage-inducible protein DinB